MAFPKNLFIVRHGQSEGNIANRASRKGDDSLFTDKFKNRHSSHYRLTNEGINQAKITGQFLKSLQINFDTGYVSTHVRTLETAAFLNLENIIWSLSPQIIERDWGHLDAITDLERKVLFAENLKSRDKEQFLWKPEGGESLVEVLNRVRDIFGTLHRQHENENVILVTHGETSLVIRVGIEKLSPKEFRDMKEDENQDIGNCSILHYSRINPVTNQESDHLDWVRMISVAGDGANFDWKKINRKKYSNQELLEIVENYERLID